MSIAEALSLGLPVVLTRAPYNGAIDDIARNGYNSLIVEHNNPDAIAHALEELYRSPDMWEQLSQNAKRSAPLNSWDDVAMNVEAVYNKVLSTRL
jgi:glycosyltransferase involved in cell wall biosynthesis